MLRVVNLLSGVSWMLWRCREGHSPQASPTDTQALQSDGDRTVYFLIKSGNVMVSGMQHQRVTAVLVRRYMPQRLGRGRRMDPGAPAYFEMRTR
jgi:hypothetical protein